MALPPAKVDEPPAPRIEAGVEARIEDENRHLPPAEREIERRVKPSHLPLPPRPCRLRARSQVRQGHETRTRRLAAIALFVLVFVYPGLLRKSSRAPLLPRPDSSQLQLRVERANGELLLTWNRDAEAIRNASKAVLTITDGDQHENVSMDLAQLANGSIVYSIRMAPTSASRWKSPAPEPKDHRHRNRPHAAHPSLAAK